MQLYLMRHGAAVDVGQKGVKRDADRMLSDEGIEKTRAAAVGLSSLLDAPLARVIASPLVRARQTAEIAAQVAAPDIEVELSDALQSGAHASDTIGWLSGQPDAPTLLVGHMPDLSVLASFLVAATDHAGFHFRKSAVLCLHFGGRASAGKGEVMWFLQPGMLRRLARE
jgi:phosphohistidine phosphatase